MKKVVVIVIGVVVVIGVLAGVFFVVNPFGVKFQQSDTGNTVANVASTSNENTSSNGVSGTTGSKANNNASSAGSSLFDQAGNTEQSDNSGATTPAQPTENPTSVQSDDLEPHDKAEWGGSRNDGVWVKGLTATFFANLENMDNFDGIDIPSSSAYESNVNLITQKERRVRFVSQNRQLFDSVSDLIKVSDTGSVTMYTATVYYRFEGSNDMLSINYRIRATDYGLVCIENADNHS